MISLVLSVVMHYVMYYVSLLPQTSSPPIIPPLLLKRSNYSLIHLTPHLRKNAETIFKVGCCHVKLEGLSLGETGEVL